MSQSDEQREMESRITVEALRGMLEGIPGAHEITFGSTIEGIPLCFSRIRRKGPELVLIELVEASLS